MTSRRRSPWAVVGVLAALVVAVNLGLRELDRATRSPGGPSSSSFATAAEGVAAYAELLDRQGRSVVRLREPPAEARLDPAATLVVLEPAGLTGEDGVALRRFVEAGGRLVAGGNPDPWLGRILRQVPAWTTPSPQLVEPRGISGVGAVRTAGAGAWRIPGGGLLLDRELGRGSAVLLADPSPLQNRLLGAADNAALGLALAGEGRPVVFAESVHGYGPASGLDAIPARWWWVFGGLALAAVVLALARGRRLGPPERADRELPPARVEFAEALATQLARMRPRQDAVQAARRVARDRLVRSLRVAADAGGDDLRAAAAARGFSPDAVETVLGDGRSDAELLAIGRALVRMESEEAKT